MTNLCMITGASAGLGVEFARQLAAQGQNLLLVARRAERLEALAAELAAKQGVQVLIEAADLSEPGAAAKLMQAVARRGLTVETLINNAGFGLKGEFAALDGQRQSEMIALNCTALTELCHAVLPGMIARKSGGILNVASTAAFQAGPLMAVYYATKAYVLSFSEALHDEVKAQGVRVSCLCPGATATEFATVAGMTQTALFKLAVGPEKVVADGLAALKRNQAFIVSGFQNRLFAFGTRLGPRALNRWIAHRLQA
ncbi:MAG: SDR family oxidoreductase [Alphaproteobacteria bacterium]|nr:SDR family oxidoreductase [Alphaproteobacteria bacterium]